jgi:2-dehydro-3-deoxygluconokinase
MRTLGAVGEGLVEVRATPDGAAAISPGGDAANVAVMAARLGADGRLAGRVGDDALGSFLLASWRRNGVDVRCVQRDPEAPTGLYVNEVLPGRGHRYTYWRRGSAGSRLESDDLASRFYVDLAVVIVTGVTLAVSDSAAAAAEAAIDGARARGVRSAIVMNYRSPLAADPYRLASVARRSDVVIASTEDCEAVFGTAEPIEAADALGDGPEEILITNGRLPATLILRDGVICQEAPRVPVVSTGGAGDALAGAYLAARILDNSPAHSLAWGVAAATFSIQRAGCVDSYPDARDVRALSSRLPRPITERPRPRTRA